MSVPMTQRPWVWVAATALAALLVYLGSRSSASPGAGPSLLGPTQASDFSRSQLTDATDSCSDLLRRANAGYVHFTWTSAENQTTLRRPLYLCAIESALAHIDEHQLVIIWVDAVMRETLTSRGLLTALPNHARLRLCTTDANTMFSATPFTSWQCSGQYCLNNFSNALRLALLYKLGGTYLDLDLLTLRRTLFSRTAHIAVVQYENESWYNNGFLSFPAQHPLLWQLMEDFVQNFDGVKYGHNGPKLMDRVIKPCMQEGKSACADLATMSETMIAPVHWKNCAQVLNSTGAKELSYLPNWVASGLWGLHWYSSQWYKGATSAGTTGCISQGSLMQSTMQRVCPITLKDLSSAVC